MSILHLLGAAGEGGAETYFLDLVTALRRAGVEQACALRPNARREAALAAADVPAEPFGFGGPLDLATRPRIAAYARAHDAKALVAWMSRAARHAPKGPWARIGRLGGYYDLKYYAGFDLLVANTADICGWIARQGWPAAKVRHIPNFAAPAQDAAPIDRASLDTPPGVPLLLGMGRLHEAKAHDVTLQALAQIPEAWLWLAGVGPQEAALKRLAAELGVADRVRFLGWRNDPSALYRTADVCLFPSRYEPLGNVVIQAWAHGLPVVAAASQGPRDLIHQGEDGLLVAVDDPGALAAAAQTLIGDAGLRRALAANGLKRVAAEFSEAAVVGCWRDLFAELGAL